MGNSIHFWVQTLWLNCEKSYSMLFVKLILLFLFTFAIAEEGFYDKNPHIYELTPSNFDKVVHKSNYTTIVEFYAPWCGYCKQLKNVYTKLGKFMQKDSKYGVHVAAVNCDKSYNKDLCVQQRVSGYPTLKVYRPPKFDEKKPKALKHTPEDYSGQRAFKLMVDFLTSRIKNYVKKLHNYKSVGDWLSNPGKRFRVVLITESNIQTPMYKTLALDFLGHINFAFISEKNTPPETIEVGGKSISIPKSEKPIVLLVDTQEKTIEKFNGKASNKLKLTEWISALTGIEPGEGELSKKDKLYYSNYRLGKKASKKTELDHDEL